jgi:hypothetical protein
LYIESEITVSSELTPVGRGLSFDSQNFRQKRLKRAQALHFNSFNLNRQGVFMKLVLYFCVLILGQSAFAGSSGGFDDDDVPAARPSASRPAAARPASVKSYPQCSERKWETNPERVREMFEKVLKYDENYPIRLAEDNPCTGNGCASVSLKKDPSGVLMISIETTWVTAGGPSKVCQSGSLLHVTIDTRSYGKRALVISRKSSRQVNIEMVDRPDLNNSYTVR